MTPDAAHAFADELQERVTQMGDRTGEGHYLGQCLSVIRDLAAQVDAHESVPVSGADPVRAAEPADRVHVVRSADATAEVGTGAAPVTESILDL